MRVNNDGLPLFYDLCGEGSDVVLLHPFPLSHLYWEPLAAHLEDRHRLILPDLRGMGLSGIGDGPATMEAMAGDVLRICDAVGVEKAVFFGCSIGCYVIWELWRHHSDRIRALILSSTRAGADTEAGREQRLLSAETALRSGTAAVVEPMVAKQLGASTLNGRPDVVSAIKSMMLRTPAAGIAAVQRGMALRPDSIAILPEISVPTLVYGGEEDVIAPADELGAMARLIPMAEFHSIPRSGHLAAYENPDEVARIVRLFLGHLDGY